MKRTLLLLFAGLMLSATASAQTVTTYAGVAYNGGGQYESRSNIPLLQRNFSRPYGIVYDRTINCYYVSHEHGIVVLYGSVAHPRSGYSGDPTLGAGNTNGVGTAARFTELTSMDYNPNTKSFYIVDQGKNIIKKISTSAPPVADFTESTKAASVGQTVILKDVCFYK